MCCMGKPAFSLYHSLSPISAQPLLTLDLTHSFCPPTSHAPSPQTNAPLARGALGAQAWDKAHTGPERGVGSFAQGMLGSWVSGVAVPLARRLLRPWAGS